MKTPVDEIMYQARQRSLRLERRGDKIAILPGSKAPPEFVAMVREHKGELLDLLQAQADGLKEDEQTWFHIAKQILCREWDDADDSTRESLIIGLRSIPHATCRMALERLRAKEGRQ